MDILLYAENEDALTFQPPVYAKDGLDSYHTIMLKMKYYGVHRVFVLDKHKRPVRVISLTDIMKVLANPENQTIMLPKKA